jgi:hypothetical protein
MFYLIETTGKKYLFIQRKFGSANNPVAIGQLIYADDAYYRVFNVIDSNSSEDYLKDKYPEYLI